MRQILCPVVIGRDEELGLLEEALGEARKGRGRVILIRGGAGVGKSRLTVELEASAREFGMRTLRGRAVASSSPVPFRPFAEALLGATRDTGPPDAPELAAYRSVLGFLIPEWSEGPGPVADPGLLLHEAALRLLRVLAADGALVTLEDIHWADAETIALLEYLADHLTSERVLCVATVRSDEPPPALPLPAVLAARRTALVLSLGRLSHVEVEAMARATLDVPQLPDGLEPLLASRAEGVPFLVEEILASCVASGALEREGVLWRLRADQAPRIPETFQVMIRERLRVLNEQDRAVLGAAAVLGRDFDWSLIAEVAGFERGIVLSALRSMVDAQIVSHESNDEGRPAFSFRHALTRDAVLEDLLPPERTELAARAADAVERAHPGLPGDWCQRAADLRELAGDQHAAARLLLESGRRSLARTALASAEAVLVRARSLAGDDRELAVEVNEVLVDVLSLAGKPDRAIEAGERLVASLEPMKASSERMGSARLSLARALAWAGHWDRARGELDAAAGLAKAAADEGLLARVWSFAAQVEVWRGAYQAGIELASRALAIAERLDLSEVACECLDVLGRRASVQSYERGIEIFRRELEIAERGDLRLWKVRALLERGTIEMMSTGEIGSLVEAAELAESDGAISALALSLQNQWWTLLFAMRWDEAASTNERCVELCRRFGLGLLPHALIVTALIHTVRGEVPEMEATLEEAESSTDDLNIRGAASGCRGTAALLREDRDRAIEALEQANGLFRETQAVTNWHFLGLRAILVELEGPGGEDARAELRGIRAPLACWNEASLDLSEAVALGRTGRSREAEAAFARAEERIKWAPWLRGLHLRLAAEAAIADGWGEPVGWLRRALPLLESAGHDRVVAACKGLLRKAGAPLPRKGRGESEVPSDLRSSGVTSREMDVLRLVSEGLSNREIGTILFLSHRTVETHVASLQRKTGVATRADLAALASTVLGPESRG